MYNKVPLAFVFTNESLLENDLANPKSANLIVSRCIKIFLSLKLNYYFIAKYNFFSNNSMYAGLISR